MFAKDLMWLQSVELSVCRASLKEIIDTSKLPVSSDLSVSKCSISSASPSEAFKHVLISRQFWY